MKDFKTKQQMTAGHYCWGDMPMKKAKGGPARASENPMRSESTEAAKSGPEYERVRQKFHNFIKFCFSCVRYLIL